MWHTAIATAVRNQRSNLRAYPWTFTFGHIIDGVYLVLVSYFSYYFLIRGELDARFQMYAGSSNYLAYVIIGGALSIFSVSMIMNVSRALMTEWREGTLEALLLAPAGRGGYFLGNAAQQLYRSGFELAVILAAGYLAGLRFAPLPLGAVCLSGLIFLLSCYSMALVLGSVMLYTRDTYIVQNTFFAITTLLCGFQFPRQYLPRFLQAAAEIFPLTSALQLLRSTLLTGEGFELRECFPALLLSALYISVGLWANHRIERGLFERF